MADARTHLFANNATCRLGENVDANELSIQLETGKGALFPNPDPGQIFVLTIEDLVLGVREIMYCTARDGDVVTVERGKEGTTAREWIMSNNIVVQNRVTAGTLEYLAEGAGSANVYIQLACSDLVSDLEAGTSKAYVRAPRSFTITEVRASLLEASSSGPVHVDINKNGVSILYSLITIDEGEKTSTTSATPEVIDDPNVVDDDELTIDIDSAGTGAKGLIVTLIGTP